MTIIWCKNKVDYHNKYFCVIYNVIYPKTEQEKVQYTEMIFKSILPPGPRIYNIVSYEICFNDTEN